MRNWVSLLTSLSRHASEIYCREIGFEMWFTILGWVNETNKWRIKSVKHKWNVGCIYTLYIVWGLHSMFTTTNVTDLVDYYRHVSVEQLWQANVLANKSRTVTSRVAQWERAGLITQRSMDRNHPLLTTIFSKIFTKPWIETTLLAVTCIRSRVAQWERAGLITQRSMDRNHPLLKKENFPRGYIMSHNFFPAEWTHKLQTTSTIYSMVFVNFVITKKLLILYAQHTITMVIQIKNLIVYNIIDNFSVQKQLLEYTTLKAVFQKYW